MEDWNIKRDLKKLKQRRMIAQAKKLRCCLPVTNEKGKSHIKRHSPKVLSHITVVVKENDKEVIKQYRA